MSSATEQTIDPTPGVDGLQRMQVPPRLLFWLCICLTSWLFLFGCGLLIETVEYRLMLSPRSVQKQLVDADYTKIVGSSPLLQYQHSLAKPPESALRDDGQPPSWRIAHAFLASVFCFTPINLSLLTLVAGLIGGYSSNIHIETMSPQERQRLQRQHGRRHDYLQEPPVTAAMRGFIVYLCIVAGLYIAMDDPFKDPTPAQYIRLAGMLSILAFMVGYDASRLEDWLALVPRPGAKKELEDNNSRRRMAGHPSNGAGKTVLEENTRLPQHKAKIKATNPPNIGPREAGNHPVDQRGP